MTVIGWFGLAAIAIVWTTKLALSMRNGSFQTSWLEWFGPDGRADTVQLFLLLLRPLGMIAAVVAGVVAIFVLDGGIALVFGAFAILAFIVFNPLFALNCTECGRWLAMFASTCNHCGSRVRR